MMAKPARLSNTQAVIAFKQEDKLLSEVYYGYRFLLAGGTVFS